VKRIGLRRVGKGRGECGEPLPGSAIDCYRKILAVDGSFSSAYTASGGSMEAENLADVIRSLTPEEQESVEQFVHFLKRRGSLGLADR
jgi:hypothetical protein